MMKEVKETPVLIRKDRMALFGMLRTPEHSNSLVILLPAVTGTRTGPQNIFVEIARSLAQSGTACLCIELPSAGDSYDPDEPGFSASQREALFAKYAYYLDIVTGYVAGLNTYKHTYLGSISVGCLPVLAYCRRQGLEGVVLLSPNHFGQQTPAVSKKNLKTYFYKALQWKTWKKIFLLQVNYRKVMRNIKPRSPKPAAAAPAANEHYSDTVKVLCIFGERDEALQDARSFWAGQCRKNPGLLYQEAIIPGADHSFFGWHFKKEVRTIIVNWIKQHYERADVLSSGLI